MAKIVFDSAYEYDIDGYYERLQEEKFTAYKNYKLDEGSAPTINPIETFSTVIVKDNNGNTIPLVGEYTVIDNFNISYTTALNVLSVTIDLG